MLHLIMCTLHNLVESLAICTYRILPSMHNHRVSGNYRNEIYIKCKASSYSLLAIYVAMPSS